MISKYWVANSYYNIDGYFNGCSYLSNHIGVNGSNQFLCTDFDKMYNSVIDGFSASIKSNLSSITKTTWGKANTDDGSGYQVYYNGMNHTSKMAMPSAKELNLHTKYHYHDYRDYWVGSTYEYFLNGGSTLIPSLDSEYIKKYGGGTYASSYMLRDFYFSTGYDYMNCNGSSYPVATDHGCSPRVVTNNNDGTTRSSAYLFMPYGSYGGHSHNLVGIIRFAKK